MHRRSRPAGRVRPIAVVTTGRARTEARRSRLAAAGQAPRPVRLGAPIIVDSRN